MTGISKALKQLLQQCRAYGITIASIEQGKRHFKLRFNEFPQFVVVAATPSDCFAYKNALGDIRRIAKQHKEKCHEH